MSVIETRLKILSDSRPRVRFKYCEQKWSISSVNMNELWILWQNELVMISVTKWISHEFYDKNYWSTILWQLVDLYMSCISWQNEKVDFFWLTKWSIWPRVETRGQKYCVKSTFFCNFQPQPMLPQLLRPRRSPRSITGWPRVSVTNMFMSNARKRSWPIWLKWLNLNW